MNAASTPYEPEPKRGKAAGDGKACYRGATGDEAAWEGWRLGGHAGLAGTPAWRARRLGGHAGLAGTPAWLARRLGWHAGVGVRGAAGGGAAGARDRRCGRAGTGDRGRR